MACGPKGHAISIHALLAESDRSGHPDTHRFDAISIHALLAESDLNCSLNGLAMRYFYPRSPCGERLPSVLHSFRPLQISIHALLAESDTDMTKRFIQFRISIHALLAESDNDRLLPTNKTPHFYPRSPCGERPRMLLTRFFPAIFLSTLSLRRATTFH